MVALSASQSRAADFNERLQHALQIKRRPADHLEHVGGRGLLLQRLAKIVGALAKLLEQSCIFNRDDRLICERF
jgi:hypothetical protein